MKEHDAGTERQECMKNPFYPLLALVLKAVLKKPAVFGLENVTGQTPSIFVSNHEGFFAPVYLMLFVKLDFIPWVVYENFNIRLCREYIKGDFVEPALHLHEPWSSLVAGIISPICVGIMKYVHAIPVYHSSKSIVETMERSIRELENGRNLLIFPEDPKDRTEPYIRAFQTGFFHLAKMMYEKNRKPVSFYPIYVNRRTNQIRIGEGIPYNPASPFHQEQKRILHALRESMLAMRTESEK
jgi:hypothetical protein